MNWTGGRLQRHSRNAGQAVVQRQKQHFAKVRTQLQNGRTAHAVPFRPSFLDEEGLDLRDQLPSFGVGSVRNVGQSKRLQQRLDEEEAATPDARMSGRGRALRARNAQAAGARTFRRGHRATSSDGLVTHERASSLNGGRNHRKRGNAEKRKLTDMTEEYQLLEANRKRLLKRQDWVGLAPSRPVNMHFASRRDKDKICKRGKIEERPIIQQASKEKIMRWPPHHTDGKSPRPYMSGAFLNDIEGVKIRIGIDALTNQPSTQHSQTAGMSPAESSDPMLFDIHQSMYMASKEALQHTQSASTNHRIPIRSFTQIHTALPERLFPEEQASESGPEEDQQPDRSHASDFHPDFCMAQGITQRDRDRDQQRNFGKYVPANASPQKGNIGASFHVTEHVGGAARPFRLVFNDPYNFSAKGPCGALQGNVEGPTPPRDAGLPEFRDEENETGNEQENVRIGERLARESPIVNDAPWKIFLAIPDDSSSHSTTGLGLLRLSQRPDNTTKHPLDPTVESRRATVGNATRTSSSSHISASLASISRADRSSRPGCLWQRINKRGKSPVRKGLHDVFQSEELWKAFVFGNNNPPASDTIRGNPMVENEKSPITPLAYRPSRILIPSSLAVASSANSILLPAPSRLVSREASCVSDSI
ncbi:hypothetical protein K469DRAFT_252419 [Zopfia rhizophila CBS 207.26]|uniref:Uncharacterized protein n=1 Tax=Zopfia rhizophila CBS 207.26 TaxID=1314779 RepID=A0A6A6DQY1_9PEZI|nr:hypothetical protein K469DRAFT_252419 [Zopfia rhizophila CBS 207.26]